MNYVEYIKMSLKNLVSSKSRSFLTMLGIIIGISSVIMITTLGNGSKENISGDLKEIGSNTVSIEINKYGNKKIEKEDLLKETDVEVLKSHPEISEVSPEFSKEVMINIPGIKEKKYLIVTAANKEIFNVFNLKILNGRIYSDKENENKEKVIIIDSLLSKRMYGKTNSVGEIFQIQNGSEIEDFLIIGVFKNPFENFVKLTGDVEGMLNVIIPRKTAEKFYKTTDIDKINIKIKNNKKMSKVILDIKKILENIHNNEDKYIVKNESKEIETFDNILKVITLFISFVASISLIVGGIGVMNIMLVSVKERTREIGIRKALGAENKDILIQFLLESVILSVIGGLTGIVLGYFFAAVIAKKMAVKAILKLSVILISVGVSVLTGIVFEVMPARIAAGLEPIEALRYE